MNRKTISAASALVAAAISLALAPQRAAAQEAEGAAIYKQSCQGCHGPTGVPSKKMQESYPGLKSFADSGYVNALVVDSAVTALRTGVGHKKSFAGKLTDAQLKAVMQYVKALPGQKSAP